MGKCDGKLSCTECAGVCSREGWEAALLCGSWESDFNVCYWLRYEKNGKQIWQRVGDYDLVKREKLRLERRLSAAAQGFVWTDPLNGDTRDGHTLRGKEMQG
jgi:hypothetical protein